MTIVQRQYWSITLTALVLAVAGCSSDNDQLRDSAACKSCAIEHNAYWNSPEGDEALTAAIAALEIDSMVLVVGGLGDVSFLRYPVSGSLPTVQERSGGGPGEFLGQVLAVSILPSEDSLYIAEEYTVHIFDRELQEVRRFSSPIGVLGYLVPLEDGGVVISNPRATVPAAADGYSFHKVDATGNYQSSFSQSPAASRSTPIPIRLAADPGAMWSAVPDSTGFTLERWSVRSRERERSMAIALPWWYTNRASSEETEVSAMNNPTRLETGVVDLYDDGDVLWVTIRHGAEDLEPGTMDFLPAHWYDGILLAIDPADGTIMATARFDEFPVGFTNAGKLILYSQDDRGAPSLQISELHLRQ